MSSGRYQSLGKNFLLLQGLFGLKFFECDMLTPSNFQLLDIVSGMSKFWSLAYF